MSHSSNVKSILTNHICSSFATFTLYNLLREITEVQQTFGLIWLFVCNAKSPLNLNEGNGDMHVQNEAENIVSEVVITRSVKWRVHGNAKLCIPKTPEQRKND